MTAQTLAIMNFIPELVLICLLGKPCYSVNRMVFNFSCKLFESVIVSLCIEVSICNLYLSLLPFRVRPGNIWLTSKSIFTFHSISIKQFLTIDLTIIIIKSMFLTQLARGDGMLVVGYDICSLPQSFIFSCHMQNLP